MLSGAAPAVAADYVVTKTADTRDGSCDADCSLRDAVEAASAAPDADVITLGSGTYDVTRYDGGDGSTDGDLDVTGGVTIRGASPSATTVRLNLGAGHHDGVFGVHGAGTHAVLEDFTVTGGDQWGTLGGGVNAWDGADLTLRRMVVRGNQSDYNAGSASGGGVHFDGGALLVEDSAFLDNTADWGGGLAVGDGSAVVVNTTFTGNAARVTGGAISVNGGRPVALRHVTIVGNQQIGGSYAGAIGMNPFGVTIQSSIVAGNGEPECDVSGVMRPASLGGNVGPLAATDSTCQLTAAAGDRLVASPGLAATPTVGANGVPVLLPLAGSHAIGAVTTGCPPADAAGRARPGASSCAAGAAEPLPGTPGPGAADGGTPAPGGPAGGSGAPAAANAAPAVPGLGAPGGADTVAPRLVLPKRLDVDARRRRARLALACPANERNCTITARIERTHKRRSQRLASGVVRIAGGRTATLRLRLTPNGRAAVAGRRTARATLKLTVRDAAGNERAQQRGVTLRVVAP